MGKSQSISDIAKIKIAMKQLSIPDDDGDPDHGVLSTYRSMLKRVTGKTSVAQGVMSDCERKQVLRELGRLGFRPSKFVGRNERRKAPGMASDGQIAMLRHLWARLAAGGALQAGEDASLNAWIVRSTSRYNGGAGYDSVDFLPKKIASLLIEELKQWCKRLDIEWR